MIAALARAACVLEEPRYLAAARAAADFVRTRMQTPDGRLLHRWCGGEPAMTGNLDDYAFMVWGLIELYEAGFAAGDLRMALELQRILTDRFRDPEGGFFFTPDDGEELLTRLKEGHDGAVPSGNAVTLMNLIRLGRMTGDPRLEEEAAKLSRAFAESVRRLPSAHAQWLVALEMLAAPSCEVVIAGRPEAGDTRELIEVVRRCRSPRPVLLLRPEGETEPEIARIAPFTREMQAIGGRAAAYVCSGFSCKRPVTDPKELAALLAAGAAGGARKPRQTASCRERPCGRGLNPGGPPAARSRPSRKRGVRAFLAPPSEISGRRATSTSSSVFPPERNTASSSSPGCGRSWRRSSGGRSIWWRKGCGAKRKSHQTPAHPRDKGGHPCSGMMGSCWIS